MANQFLAPAEASPTTLASGGSVEVKLLYNYDPIDPGEPKPTIAIAASPGFNVIVEQAAALEPAANGTAKIKLKIERKKATSLNCTLTFKALNDKRSVAVEVT